MKLQEYDYDIIYKPGHANSNADAVSRIPDMKETLVTTLIPDSDRLEWARQQHLDKDISEIIKCIEDNKNNEHTKEINNNYLLDDDGLLWKKMKTIKEYEGS